MGKKESFETIWDFLESHFRFCLLFLSVLLLFVSGMLLARIWQFKNKPRLEYSVQEEETSNNGSDNKNNVGYCFVDVSGAVVNPGVYELEKGSRVKDAIASAGGFSSHVDEDWVAKNLNLAAAVTDGQKIYILEEGEVTKIAGTSADNLPDNYGGGGGAGVSENKINLNQASKDVLETLPGIGPALAERIIEYRNQTPFETVEEITAVKGIGEKTLQDLRDRVFVP
ncbi:MAG: ComEA family DNA-binding protein [Patescibacteria group bacterium]|nr:ComEA family DNA-binding protein [Patescibacteria group bacterium]